MLGSNSGGAPGVLGCEVLRVLSHLPPVKEAILAAAAAGSCEAEQPIIVTATPCVAAAFDGGSLAVEASPASFLKALAGEYQQQDCTLPRMSAAATAGPGGNDSCMSPYVPADVAASFSLDSQLPSPSSATDVMHCTLLLRGGAIVSLLLIMVLGQYLWELSARRRLLYDLQRSGALELLLQHHEEEDQQQQGGSASGVWLELDQIPAAAVATTVAAADSRSDEGLPAAVGHTSSSSRSGMGVANEDRVLQSHPVVIRAAGGCNGVSSSEKSSIRSCSCEGGGGSSSSGGMGGDGWVPLAGKLAPAIHMGEQDGSSRGSV